MQKPLFSFLQRQTKCCPKHSWPWRTMVWEHSQHRLLNTLSSFGLSVWLSELKWDKMRLEGTVRHVYAQTNFRIQNIACGYTGHETDTLSEFWMRARRNAWCVCGLVTMAQRMEQSQEKSKLRAMVMLDLYFVVTHSSNYPICCCQISFNWLRKCLLTKYSPASSWKMWEMSLV